MQRAQRVLYCTSLDAYSTMAFYSSFCVQFSQVNCIQYNTIFCHIAYPDFVIFNLIKQTNTAILYFNLFFS